MSYRRCITCDTRVPSRKKLHPNAPGYLRMCNACYGKGLRLLGMGAETFRDMLITRKCPELEL